MRVIPLALTRWTMCIKSCAWTVHEIRVLRRTMGRDQIRYGLRDTGHFSGHTLRSRRTRHFRSYRTDALCNKDHHGSTVQKHIHDASNVPHLKSSTRRCLCRGMKRCTQTARRLDRHPTAQPEQCLINEPCSTNGTPSGRK